MSPVDGALLFLAAVGAGALNAVVGAGTLITFPTLLALGYPPVVANVSNTVGLVPGAVTATYGFRHTLVGRGTVLRRLVGASATGGIVGGALLLALPARSFELIVPVLLVAAGALAVAQPRVAAIVARRRGVTTTPASPRPAHAGPLLVLGVGAAAVYGGYFGAAQGVILLALLGIGLGGPMTELNGIKNVLAGLANLVSACLFVVIGDVDWWVVAVVAVGAGLGGGLGGRYGRRLPSRALRVLVGVVAVVAAAWQLLR